MLHETSNISIVLTYFQFQTQHQEIPKFFTNSTEIIFFQERTGVTGHPSVAYQENATTVGTAMHRMTIHKDGFIELYDVTTSEEKTKNIADEYPDLVVELKETLKSELK